MSTVLDAPSVARPQRRLSLGSLRGEPRAAVVAALTVAGLLLAWWLATRLALVSPVFLPSPGAVATKAVRLVSEGYVDSTLGQHSTSAPASAASWRRSCWPLGSACPWVWPWA